MSQRRCCGFRMGAVQHAGIVLGPAPVAAHAWTGSLANTAALQSFSAVTGACMAFRRTVFDALGGLDEGLPVTWNDIDFCLRARERGLDVVLCRDAVLQHDESATRGPDGASDNIAMVLAARAHMGRASSSGAGGGPVRQSAGHWSRAAAGCCIRRRPGACVRSCGPAAGRGRPAADPVSARRSGVPRGRR